MLFRAAPAASRVMRAVSGASVSPVPSAFPFEQSAASVNTGLPGRRWMTLRRGSEAPSFPETGRAVPSLPLRRHIPNTRIIFTIVPKPWTAACGCWASRVFYVPNPRWTAIQLLGGKGRDDHSYDMYAPVAGDLCDEGVVALRKESLH